MTEASQRFNLIANNFATSEVHAMSPTIQRLHGLVGTIQGLNVCDVACGAGHTGLSFVAQGAQACFVDPAPSMLSAVQELARQRGLTVRTVQSFAEAIPLEDNRFDLVLSRLAAHHFTDIQKAVNEMTRLTRPNGLVAVIDLVGATDPKHDALNHQVELLHDPTHIRSYTAAQWKTFFQNAGLTVECFEPQHTERPGGVPLHRWCEIASSGEAAERELRQLLGKTPEDQLSAIGIQRQGEDFLIPVRTLLITGRKSAHAS